MPNSDPDRRKQLAQMYDNLMQAMNKSSSADKLAQAKEFAETLRKELEGELEHNEDLWTEKNIGQTLNEHMNKTIDDHRELIEQLNEIANEDQD